MSRDVVRVKLFRALNSPTPGVGLGRGGRGESFGEDSRIVGEDPGAGASGVGTNRLVLQAGHSMVWPANSSGISSF